MKSNEARETLQQHQRRTSVLPKDLSMRPNTSSALTSLDPAILGANYLPRLVLQEHHQGQHHQGRKQPTDYTSQLVQPSGLRRQAELGSLHGDGHGPGASR